MTTDTSKKRGLLLAGVLVIAVAAAAAGAWLGAGLFMSAQGPHQEAMRAATLLPTPKPLAPFSLTDQDGHPYTLDDLRGKWTFVAIGYTSCPDVCPTTMAILRAVSRTIGKKAEAEPLANYLLVSVDPERDSPQRLAQYVRHFDPAFLGATGSHEQLKALMAQLGALYERVDDAGSAMSYLVDHSATVFLLDPEARLIAVFGAPQDPHALATDFQAIVRGSHS